MAQLVQFGTLLLDAEPSFQLFDLSRWLFQDLSQQQPLQIAVTGPSRRSSSLLGPAAQWPLQLLLAVRYLTNAAAQMRALKARCLPLAHYYKPQSRAVSLNWVVVQRGVKWAARCIVGSEVYSGQRGVWWAARCIVGSEG